MNNKKGLEILLDDLKDEDNGNNSDDNFVMMNWRDMLMNVVLLEISSGFLFDSSKKWLLLSQELNP